MGTEIVSPVCNMCIRHAMHGLTVQSSGWPILQEAMPHTLVLDQLQHKSGITLEDFPEHLKRWHSCLSASPQFGHGRRMYSLQSIVLGGNFD